MSGICRRVFGFWSVFCVVGLSWSVFAGDAFAQGRRGGGEPKLKVGQEAPDFELPKLVITRDADGNPVGKISDEKVKLSSFRGKKPVCMIMSSYT